MIRILPSFWCWGFLALELLLIAGRLMPEREIQIAARIVALLVALAVGGWYAMLRIEHGRCKEFFRNLLQADEYRLLDYASFRHPMRKPPFWRHGYWMREYEFQQERNRVLSSIDPDTAADFVRQEDLLSMLRVAMFLPIPIFLI